MAETFRLGTGSSQYQNDESRHGKHFTSGWMCDVWNRR
jgi:hypothetical protein